MVIYKPLYGESGTWVRPLSMWNDLINVDGKTVKRFTNVTEEKLACSLTAETTELVPFLPYLLQDFWELGSDPDIMTELISKHINISDSTRILDLACGKGAVSVKVAHKLRIKINGIDIIPAFIEFAIEKAKEWNVDSLCEFEVRDINAAVSTERGYDCVIFGAVGNVLGNPAETLEKLKSTIKTGGYILIDEAYLPDNGKQEDLNYDNYELLSKQQWTNLFAEMGLELVETVSGDDFADMSNPDSDEGMAFIIARANELI